MRPWWIVAGSGLVIVCVLCFMLVATRLDQRSPVLQVVRPVAAGQVLTASDVQATKVSADPSLHLVAAADRSRVVGHPVRLPLASGSLLTSSSVGDAAWPPPGQMVAAVEVKPGQAPELSAGEHTTVFLRPSEASTTPTDQATTAPQHFRAVVVDVRPAADGQGTYQITLLMASADAESLALAPEDGVVVMREGGQ